MAKNYQFDKPKPNETFEEYLIRHKAHPKQKDRREATQEEMDAMDITKKVLGMGYVISKKK
jgi:hypothetical protein